MNAYPHRNVFSRIPSSYYQVSIQKHSSLKILSLHCGQDIFTDRPYFIISEVEPLNNPKEL
jgi:hypothetical protein